MPDSFVEDVFEINSPMSGSDPKKNERMDDVLLDYFWEEFQRFSGHF